MRLPAFLLFGLFGLLCKVFAQLRNKGRECRKSIIRHSGNGADQLAFCIIIILQPRKYFRKLFFARFLASISPSPVRSQISFTPNTRHISEIVRSLGLALPEQIRLTKD